MAYPVELLTIEQKEGLSRKYASNTLHEIKSDIYGCCIKLLTAVHPIKDRWEEVLYFTSQIIRSHGCLYVIEDKTEGVYRVLYGVQSKTAFLFNIDYYGWIKSLALSLAGDIL